MAQYQRLPVPDYVSGMKSQYARDSNNLARLHQAQQVNAQRRVQNIQEFTSAMSGILSLAGTVNQIQKQREQEKFEANAAATFQVRAENFERVISGINAKERGFYKDKIKYDKYIDSFSDDQLNKAEKLALKEAHIWKEKELAVLFAQRVIPNLEANLHTNQNAYNLDKKNLPGVNDQIINSIAYNILAKAGFSPEIAAKFINKPLRKTRDALVKKYTTENWKENQNAQLEVNQQRIKESIKNNPELIGETVEQTVNTYSTTYFPNDIKTGRVIGKSNFVNDLSSMLKNNDITEEQFDDVLASTIEIDGKKKTISEYLSQDQRDRLNEDKVIFANARAQATIDLNKAKFKADEQKFITEILPSMPIEEREEAILKQQAFYRLNYNNEESTRLDKYLTGIKTGSEEYRKGTLYLKDLAEKDELTVEIVESFGNLELEKEWLQEAQRQDNLRETPEYKNALKSIKNVFIGNTKFMNATGGLSPGANQIVEELEGIFKDTLKDLDQKFPNQNNAGRAATEVEKYFLAQGGGRVDGSEGRYVWDPISKSFKNFINASTPQISESYNLLKHNLFNITRNVEEKIKAGGSLREALETPGVFLWPAELEQIEKTYDATGNWTPLLKELGDRYKVPPWVIYNQQGGKKIKATKAFEVWNMLNKPLQISMISDPTENTYNHIAYALSDTGINDENLNMQLHGQPNAPRRPAFA